MALTPTRINAPVKGWNTISPIREMSQEFAIRLENVWFDQAGGMNRRPAQTTVDNAAPSANPIQALFEHYSITGLSTIYAWCTDSNIYQLSGATWSAVPALAAVFTSKPRGAMLQNVLILGDGVNVRSYNGTVWATPTTIGPMSNFTTYNGRMYGCGDPVNVTAIYYSAPNTGLGATDWSIPSGGGFIDASGAMDRGDSVIALKEYQGFLVAFCSNSIIFYQGSDPNTPSTFRVQKVIKGIGCYSADTIQGIGNDVMFLSNYGFKSLQEVMVQGDAAAFETSIPINNYVIDGMLAGNITNLSSTFAEKYGVYLCTFGTETLCYHIMFEAWSSWNGIQQTLFTTKAGLTYTATTRLHNFSTTLFADNINGVTGLAIPFVWELPPYRSSSTETKARWNRLEIIYEGTISDTVTLIYWPDLDTNNSSTEVIVLEPTVPIASSTDLLYAAIATANPRNAWGTAITGPSWSGGTTGTQSGDEMIPVYGRSELLSVRIENANATKFRLTAMEVYYNDGGLRK